jgi:hypothetical protein
MKTAGFAGSGGSRFRRRVVAMDFDSYESPDAETLLKSARDRFVGSKHAERLLATEATGAAVFLVTAFAFSLSVTSARHLSVTTLALTVAAYLVAAQVQFPVGSAWSRPTQVVFVPMLFLLPIALVPPIVAGCLILDLWPEIPRHRVSLMRVLARLGDSLYALGPALVSCSRTGSASAGTTGRFWPALSWPRSHSTPARASRAPGSPTGSGRRSSRRCCGCT